METLINPRPRKKKLKEKDLKPAPTPTNKWQNMPIENWEKLKYEEILSIPQEKIKKEKPRFIRVYVDHIKKVEWWGFLLDIAKKNNKKFLIIQQLGVRENQKKVIEVAITERTSIELSID